tara:strand:- start:1415 stop:1762 length:348 start_codon:yes stop_codon:yes gene_type:complete
MKKLLLLLLVLTSISSYSQYEGKWLSFEATERLHIYKKNNNWKFRSFSIDTVRPFAITIKLKKHTSKYLSAKIHNPNNGWKVNVKYKLYSNGRSMTATFYNHKYYKKIIYHKISL